MTRMRVLGIETSCDDTGAGIVENGRLLAHVVRSQDIHVEYGGVVPELASRAHITLLPKVVDEVLANAGLTLGDIDAVAATMGPGLVGSLLVGLEFAKGLAMARGIPFAAVNHVEAHLLSPALEHEVPLPAVGMVASGGHTEIYHVPETGRFVRLGSTRDDAAGEAFDKVGKLLGLPYPGGPEVDRLAREGNPDAIAFPVARLGPDTLDVSMSGLKTAVKLLVEKEPSPIPPRRVRDIAASAERAVVTALVERLTLALDRHPARALLLAGGCACNTLLRSEATRLAASRGIPALFPSPPLCRDNGAMIAYAGWVRLSGGHLSQLTASAIPNLDAISAA
ncbi:MAG TPA: tRNA (adenosine(37)-N6)-threonylcarbamoyltransferase complex transferase subunit TsaD [Candidatus Limnocylindrales bacterium]|nr:tRNA (adenosine(37)-N6)-threonylcarbamoyltransferase complex transferase subunit TsaD [Candidatus Limnocylindrales bacterium]